MGKKLKLAAAYLLHKAIKLKAENKARKKEKEKQSLDKKLFLSIRSPKRSWQELEGNSIDQESQVKILKVKALIKSFGGSKIKVLHSENSSKVFFSGPRTILKSLVSNAKKVAGNVTSGEVREEKN